MEKIIIAGLLCKMALLMPTSFISVSGEVRELTSPLSSTGRNHVCANEPLIYSCEVHGAYLQWMLDHTPSLRAILHGGLRVDTVQMISNQSIKAILTMNEELNNVTGESKRLRSALLIDTSQIAGLHNISCSSNEGDVREQTFQVAEIPTKPIIPKRMPPSSQVLSIKWGAPNNMHRFDLDHYSVQVLIIIPESDEEDYLNGTTRELSYLFDLGQFASRSRITIHSANITAVSKCGQHSPVATTLLMSNIKMSSPDLFDHSSVSSASTHYDGYSFTKYLCVMMMAIKMITLALNYNSS